MQGFEFRVDPVCDAVYNKSHFIFVQSAIFRDLIPFHDTSPAAGSRGVLGFKNGVSFIGCLFAVIFRVFRHYSFKNKVRSVVFDPGKPYPVYVGFITIVKFKA